ncbi:MAG TPA: sigma-54-dependent Fis family transcriptional regulator [candidate division Zixibacteria bacterium]|nr:sigma-54-dependent Fis family transcriptional regulator [candidate division Zixibacteria bacterium]
MAGKVKILIIGDDKQTVESFSSLFKQKGFDPFGIYTGHKGLELALNDVFGLIMLDLNLPDINSLELLKKIKGARISAPVIITGGSDSSAAAVEAIKLGADSFVEKTCYPDLILYTALNALNRFRLEQDIQKMSKSLSAHYNFIGHSDIIEQFREKIKRIAMSSSRVLFIGEPGSGRQTAARYIHYSSGRAVEPFAVVNCAALYMGKVDSNLWLESELFGHEKGAFKDASHYHKGKFETATGGTLFLKEVGALRADIQAKLFRSIESSSIRRVGSDEEIKVDIRLVAASTIDLEAEVKAGRFREDLYFRLNVIPVVVPPLRSHPEDIPLLTRHFLDQTGYEKCQVSSEGMNYLKSYHWPENVRELKNTVVKSAIITNGDTITVNDIKSVMTASKNKFDRGIHFIETGHSGDDRLPMLFEPDMSLRQQVIELEKRLLTEVYDHCNGNITKAAAMLKTDRGNLSKKLKKLGLKTNKSS